LLFPWSPFTIKKHCITPKSAGSFVRGPKIVFGGIHVSCVPDVVIANDFVDYVVIGEGEQAFVEIIQHIENGQPPQPIVNTWYKGKNGAIIKGKQIGFIQNLDSLPHCDKDIWKDIFPLKTY